MLSAPLTLALLLLAAVIARRTAQLHADLDDNALMARFQDGDHAAFEALVRRHERPLLNFIHRRTADRERAQELTQELFLRVVRHRTTWRPEARVTTWLYTMARNLCVDESRRQFHRRASSLDEPVNDDANAATAVDRVHDTAASSPGVAIDRAAFREHLERCIQLLPDDQREVFLLRHVDGMRFTEIAEVQQASENTVKSRMRYALRTLREHLADWQDAAFDSDEQGEVNRDNARRHV